MGHHEFSPSRLEQFRLCPGSYYMQQGIKEEEGEWAKEGHLLHEAVATGKTEGLTSDQVLVVEECQKFLDSMIELGDTILKEEKLIVYDGDGIALTYGIADVLIVNEDKKKLICIDWKFGYNSVNDVHENIQVASYACGAMQRFNIEICGSWVFQPRIHRKSHHLFTNREAIITNIRAIIKKSKRTAPFVLEASESACRYCLARLNCPAFRLKFQRLSACKNDYDLSDIPTLVSLYDASKDVKSFVNEVEAAVKKIIEEKGSCGKYIFQITDGAREIKDLNALYSVVKDYLTPAEFNGLCKVSLGKFETALSDKLIAEAKVKDEKLTKTEAKSRCYAMIADLISRGAQTKKIVENEMS